MARCESPEAEKTLVFSFSVRNNRYMETLLRYKLEQNMVRAGRLISLIYAPSTLQTQQYQQLYNTPYLSTRTFCVFNIKGKLKIMYTLLYIKYDLIYIKFVIIYILGDFKTMINIKIRNTLGELIAAALAIVWMYFKLNEATNMSIKLISQVLVQGIGISIVLSILLAIGISIFASILTGSYEKNVEDERDAIFEFYAMRLSGVIFGISIVLILVLLGWFNLHINFAIIAITLSGFLASISANILKIYLYA